MLYTQKQANQNVMNNEVLRPPVERAATEGRVSLVLTYNQFHNFLRATSGVVLEGQEPQRVSGTLY